METLRGKKKNTHSKRMRALFENGVVIVANVEEWVGQPVKFAPDMECDRDPWTIAEGPEADEVRFNGAEVRPLTDDAGNLVYQEAADDDA